MTYLRNCCALTAGLVILTSANTAVADEADGVQPEPGWLHVVPSECVQYLATSAEAGDPVAGWEQALSFAACIQDGPTSAAGEPEDLDALVEGLARRLEIPMLIYLEAIDRGPAPIQLRAAFHIGMAQIALGTRARSSIAAPPDRDASTPAVLHYRALHRQLEPLLRPMRRAAWVAFAAIDEAAARDPEIAADPVARHMVRLAREMLAGLQDARPEQSP